MVQEETRALYSDERTVTAPSAPHRAIGQHPCPTRRSEGRDGTWPLADPVRAWRRQHTGIRRTCQSLTPSGRVSEAGSAEKEGSTPSEGLLGLWFFSFLQHVTCNTLGVWLPQNCISFHNHVHHLSHHAIVTETCICNILNYVCFILDCLWMVVVKHVNATWVSHTLKQGNMVVIWQV